MARDFAAPAAGSVLHAVVREFGVVRFPIPWSGSIMVKPMFFSKGMKGLKLNRDELRARSRGRYRWRLEGCRRPSSTMKRAEQVLSFSSTLLFLGFPVALGVIYCDPMPTFDGADGRLETKGCGKQDARPPEASPVRERPGQLAETFRRTND